MKSLKSRIESAKSAGLKAVKGYEIQNHGLDSAQYFRGASSYHTKHNEVVTGTGETEKEAYNDALEILSTGDIDISIFPNNPRGITSKPMPKEYTSEDSDWMFYVSIHYTLV